LIPLTILDNVLVASQSSHFMININLSWSLRFAKELKESFIALSIIFLFSLYLDRIKGHVLHSQSSLVHNVYIVFFFYFYVIQSASDLKIMTGSMHCSCSREPGLGFSQEGGRKFLERPGIRTYDPRVR
jgi:hypothetical protein